MGRIIEPSRWETYTRRYHQFSIGRHNSGSGFSFDVDENGQYTNDNPAAAENRMMCFAGKDKQGRTIVNDGIKSYTNRYRVPAILQCNCGCKVELCCSLTNTCENCGRDYNMSGQELAPRSQWGEETGESFDEIMRGNISINEDPSSAFDGDY